MTTAKEPSSEKSPPSKSESSVTEAKITSSTVKLDRIIALIAGKRRRKLHSQTIDSEEDKEGENIAGILSRLEAVAKSLAETATSLARVPDPREELKKGDEKNIISELAAIKAGMGELTRTLAEMKGAAGSRRGSEPSSVIMVDPSQASSGMAAPRSSAPQPTRSTTRRSTLYSPPVFTLPLEFVGKPARSFMAEPAAGNDGICSICLTEFTSLENTVLLQCRHRLHTACFHRHRETSNLCPLCRAVINS